MPWAWTNLVFAVPILDANPDGLRDVVTGVRPSTILNPTWTQDKRGNPSVRLSPSGAAGYAEWPHHPLHDTPSTALTVLVRLCRFGTADLTGGVFCNPYGDGVAPNQSWGITASLAGLRRAVYGSVGVGSTEHQSDDTSDLADSEDVTVFLRWSSGNPIVMSVFGKHGNLQHQGATGTPTGTINYATDQGIRLNVREDLTRQYAGNYTQAMVWSRQLPDTECAALALDPFGWCSPRRETITLAGPFPVAGHGPVQIGTSDRVLMEAPADAYGRVTEVTVTTPADQGTTLRLVVDGVEETEVVAADDTYTRPVDVYTETVEEIELQSDPDPGG